MSDTPQPFEIVEDINVPRGHVYVMNGKLYTNPLDGGLDDEADE